MLFIPFHYLIIPDLRMHADWLISGVCSNDAQPMGRLEGLDWKISRCRDWIGGENVVFQTRMIEQQND